MLIEVRQSDIDRGERSCAQGCPIALALRRATGDVWSIYPDAGGWWATDPFRHRTFMLPPEAQAFARSYDYRRGEPVQPFTFDLPLEEPAHA